MVGSTKALGIPRIGRKPTPAERGLRMAIERPEVLEAIALNTFSERRRLFGVFAQEAWLALSEAQRVTRRSRVIASLRERVLRTGGILPDPTVTDPKPQPGEGPVRRVRVR